MNIIPHTSITEDELWLNRLDQGGFSPQDDLDFATFVLGKVSRTFALNIKVLPHPLREQVLYAYLYCRMADTLEDAIDLPVLEKSRLLKNFGDLFVLGEERKDEAVAAIQAFPKELPKEWAHSKHWEHLLLMHTSVVLLPYLSLPEPVRKVISRCIGEMCVGMAQFAHRTDDAQNTNLINTLDELDDYCYYVAGTVGVLLCDLFLRHSGKIKAERAKSLRSLCISFGVGLQLTNILKDLHEDRQRNVSWLPQELLTAEKITLQDFLKADRRPEAKRVYKILLAKAKKHLEDALEYSCLIPRWDRRLRLFCLWPLFMSAETLVLLAESTETLKDGVRLKISRQQVEAIVRRTRLFCWSNRLIRMEFRKPIRRLEVAMQKLSPN